MRERERVWSDEPVPPGETLADELAARKMTQKALAVRMGRPLQVVNEIVLGKKAITAATALDLEKALGVSALTWMSLEVGYQLTKARLERKNVRRRARAERAHA
jgi:HTH-type transcriptional regulator/antitoxin HigA